MSEATFRVCTGVGEICLAVAVMFIALRANVHERRIDKLDERLKDDGR